MITREEYNRIQEGDILLAEHGGEVTVVMVCPPYILVSDENGEEMFELTDIECVRPKVEVKELSPLARFGREYYRGLMSHRKDSSAFKFGKELTVGLRFLGEDGQVIEEFTEKINSEDL